MQRRFRRSHARIWTVLAIILPLALVLAMVLRPPRPVDMPAIIVEPPSEPAQASEG